MDWKIIFVTGGSRSGKSSFVIREATRCSGRKAFIATAEALDEEMRDRIRNHRLQRGDEWETCEEPVNLAATLSRLRDSHDVIVIDCLTIWLSNLLVREQLHDADRQTTEESMTAFIEALTELKDGPRPTSGGRRLYMVSNEVGMGIVPENRLARQFRDLAGTLNQKAAAAADQVYLVTAGIPVAIKS
ncbi:MAG: bifunctional adenosylcobinamide kinase/adenosylcobinamide-phosphate guanylyltransferase [Nitrospiraceae bacterium]|nr:MAG: bifunctional adenosylcobinamide kinase/adenosylcobinamide-phosphate guanylyltransferase [Nitrospiraceae bacterium]